MKICCEEYFKNNKFIKTFVMKSNIFFFFIKILCVISNVCLFIYFSFNNKDINKINQDVYVI